MPEYRIDDAGPDHAKTFTAWVVVAGERYGGADGPQQEGGRAAGRRGGLAHAHRAGRGGEPPPAGGRPAVGDPIVAEPADATGET